jgi:hypothetical protein
MRKISALSAEFSETGQAGKMGYETAADLRSGYPKFFWEVVTPFIGDGVRYLRRTQEGQQWIANLYANVFTEEHEVAAFGPERRITADRRDDSAVPMFQIKELTGNDKRSDPRRINDKPRRVKPWSNPARPGQSWPGQSAPTHRGPTKRGHLAFRSQVRTIPIHLLFHDGSNSTGKL